jgi:GntR family transcriptional regulator
MPPTGGISKYVAVREHLLGRIRTLDAGSRLPAEPALCAEYGVSRITLRHAVDGLIASGHLVREQGRGTFVAEPKHRMRYRERFAHAVTGFYAQQSSEGFEVTSRVVQLEETFASEAAASQLGVSPAERVARLWRLRSVDGFLHHLAVTDLPLRRFPGILGVDFTDASLFSLLTTSYDVEPTRNDLLVSIRSADPFVAEHLGVEIGEGLLTVASTVFDADDAPVCYGMSFFAPRNSEIAFSLRG